MIRKGFLAVSLALLASQSDAAICDYRPSQLIGEGAASVVGTTGTAVATIGVATKAAGFYTLTNAVTGATMLGSTAGGVSAAGTVGIMGGTAGVVGATVAVITSPIAIAVGAIVATTIGVYEGACYFEDVRITDFTEVLEIMRGLASVADPDYFSLHLTTENPKAFYITIRTSADSTESYLVRNLYIVNGMLMHRDWGINTTIGNIGFIQHIDPAKK